MKKKTPNAQRPTPNAQLLRRSAALLTATARSLFQSYTRRGKWILNDESDRRAKADHDECLLLASHLRKSAKSAVKKSGRSR
jgi:hypothetical protein